MEEQVRFVPFVVCSLDAAGIPFAINADKYFYDREKHTWRDEMAPVLEAILCPVCQGPGETGR